MYKTYLSYVLRHKYFVWRTGRVAGVSIWRLLIHDWTKFLPVEFGPYARWFYGSREIPAIALMQQRAAFDKAWNHHQKNNKHHWQYWVIIAEDGTIKPLVMPPKYIREMVADWAAAGWAIHGADHETHAFDKCKAWYEKNKDKMSLQPTTRFCVEQLLKQWGSMEC